MKGKLQRLHPVLQEIKDLVETEDQTALRKLDLLMEAAADVQSDFMPEDIRELFCLLVDEVGNEEFRAHLFEYLETLPPGVLVAAALPLVSPDNTSYPFLGRLWSRIVRDPACRGALEDQLTEHSEKAQLIAAVLLHYADGLRHKGIIKVLQFHAQQLLEWSQSQRLPGE